MKRFKVNVVWSGYSRGFATYIVEAKDKPAAQRYIDAVLNIRKEIIG